MLEVCVKGNYYAKFHTHSYHCYREIQFISKTQVTRRKTLTSVEREMQVKCLVNECAKDNYYAMFHTPSYHCTISRL